MSKPGWGVWTVVICVIAGLSLFLTVEPAVSLEDKDSGPSNPLLESVSVAPPSLTGAATAGIPIGVPSGRGGMRPGLVLAYNSSAKSGWVGVGWDLQGVGSIQRNTKWGLNYNGDDYVFNSSELVYKGDTPNGEREYMAKTEGSFLRYLKYSDGKWVVTDKSGTAYTFGDSSATRQEHPTAGVFKWMLSRVQDTHGNSMTFSYIKDQGEIYIDRIDWTGGSVKFYWQARPDVPVMYTANYEVRTAWRLKTIDVTAYGQRVRAYALRYHQSAGTNRSLLESVQQYGADATVDASGTVTGVTSLPPVSVTWQEAPESGTFDENWSCRDNCGVAVYGVLTGDFNGDGKTDIFFYQSSSGSYAIRLSNGDGNFGFNWVCQDNCGTAGYQVSLGDFNGDGKTDIFFHPSPGISASPQVVRLSNGDGTFGYQVICQNNCGLLEHQALVGDFNGDGRTDIFFHPSSSTNPQVVYLSKGDGTFDPRVICENNCGQISHSALVGDFNGDGKTDIFFHPRSSTNPQVVRLSNGDGTFGYQVICENNCAPLDYWPLLGDFNGDGRTDIFFHPRSSTSPKVVYLSKGNGTFDSQVLCQDNCDLGIGYYPMPGDFNGDGKTDIFFQPFSSTNPQVVYKSKGDGTFNREVICENNCGLLDHWPLLGDFNGDGKTDFFFYRMLTGSQVVRLNRGLYPDLVSAIGNSLGGTQTITYKPSSAYSNTLLPFIVQTVSSVTANDGYGLASTTSYTYSGGFYSFAEREFRGFQYSKATDLTTAYTETWYHQDDQKKWLVWHADAFDGAGALISKTSYTYAVSTPITGVTRRDLATTYAETYDGGSISKTLYTGYAYDTYGNVTAMTVSDPASGTITARTTATDFVYNTSAYIVNRPSRTQTTINGIKVSEAWFDYDGQANGVAPTKGDLTRQTSWLSGGINPVVQHFYDTYGNRIGTIDAKGNVCSSTGYTARTDYDSTYQTFPVTVTDALCRQATSTYWGINTSLSAGNVSGAYVVPGLTATVTDPNGVTAESYWDFMGRPRATVIPPDIASAPTTLTLHVVTGITGTFPSMIVTSKRETAGGGTLDSIAYLDGLGRVIQAKSESETSGQWVTIDTTYNNRGMVETVSVPYLTPYQAGPTGINAFTARDTTQPKATTYYDHVRRPTWVINPDGTSRTTSYYQWVVTTTDEKGATTISTSDALGRLISVQEPTDGGTTTYTYDIVDASGNVTSQITDAAGNIFKTTLDTLGRKKSQVDPDLGTWSYTYDANGNLLTQTDAKNQTITLAYDKLNRITTKTYPDAKQIAYTYDSGCTYCVGRLRQVNDLTGSTTFTYDQRGRGTQVAKTLSGTLTWAETPIATNLYNQGSPAVSGNIVVWVDERDSYVPHIYMKNLQTGVESRVSATNSYQSSPAISGNIVVWTDNRNGNYDIYMKDLSTGVESAVTTNTADQYSPAISGNIVVWQDYRNGNSDIYMKDLSTGVESAVTTNTAGQYRPAVSGNIVVWVDDRNGNQDIYMKDLSTGVESPVATGSAQQSFPAISGNLVVWAEREAWTGNFGIWMKNLTTGQISQVATSGYSYGATNPKVSGSRVVWVDGRNGNLDIYMKDLSTGVETQVTTNTAGQQYPAIDGTTIVWEDLRNSNYDIYTSVGQSTGATYTTQTTYDSLDRVVDVTYPDGEVVRHSYNAQGVLDKLSSITYSLDYVGNLDYSALGKITAKTVGNNLATTYTYDPLNFRLTGLSTSGNLQNLTYAYDYVGNITALTDTVKAATQSFGYDLLDRLTSASSAASPTFSYAYTYNPIGNMLSGAGKSFTYPATGSARPHAPTSDGTCSYAYDANGNLASRTCGSTTRAFTWNYDNRLTKAAEGTTTLAEFTYDYAGARVKKVEGSTTTVYPFGHYRVKNGAVTKYYFANGRVAERDSSGVYYYHPDHLGSSNVVTNSSGAEVKATLFYPYGSTRTETGTKEIIHKYTGQEQDTSTGLYNYGARYYDPAFMHFISADSIIPRISDPQSLNHYSYVRNNPIRLIDPTGHTWEEGENANGTGASHSTCVYGCGVSTPSPIITDLGAIFGLNVGGSITAKTGKWLEFGIGAGGWIGRPDQFTRTGKVWGDANVTIPDVFSYTWGESGNITEGGLEYYGSTSEKYWGGLSWVKRESDPSASEAQNQLWTKNPNSPFGTKIGWSSGVVQFPLWSGGFKQPVWASRFAGWEAKYTVGWLRVNLVELDKRWLGGQYGLAEKVSIWAGWFDKRARAAEAEMARLDSLRPSLYNDISWLYNYVTTPPSQQQYGPPSPDSGGGSGGDDMSCDLECY